MLNGEENPQLCCCEVLLDVTRATVEDPHQRLLIKALNLILQRLYVSHVIAVRQLEVRYSRARWGVVE
jgi:hypothetical protein